ncbi:unnamed protein product [Phytophthora fragariaefolia]|uniref:Unnamed protein product n=1 Tax=Phytophthora fragariaefolia TaxID=1490495 RepID=A0A9W6X9D4_9STRA|nr:unnamed protein product [Phytophthora fragariaefolia]
MAKGSSAVPATPMKSGRIEMEGGPTPQTGSGGRLSSISERSVSFDESAGDISEAKDEEVDEYEDSESDGYDFGDDLDASDEARVPLGRAEWRIGVAVNAMSAVKVAEDTVSLLRAMGLEPQTNPSEAPLRYCPPAIVGKELKRWKRKLRLSFGTSDIGLKTPPTVRPKGDADPSAIPLPQTPKKSEQGKESDHDGVFGVKTEGTPYFQDSHMVTPRSSNKTDRLARDTEASNAQRGNTRASSGRSRRRFVPRDDSSDDESDEDDYYRKEDDEHDDPSDELARQVREVSEMERLNPTPRLELATYRPLAQIKAFLGLRNKSENSMQWLRTFVYEMKGTPTPPNEWCLERRLCHLRVKDIHELEDIINDILKSEERGSTRETSVYLSRGRDRSHGRDERRAETPRDGYRRDRHDRHGRGYDRRMDDSRHTPRISLAEASLSEMMAELQVRESKYGRTECLKSRDMRRSLEDSSCEDVEDRMTETDEDRSGSDYADPYHSDEHDHHVAAANDAERRAEAVGTYGWSENRGRRGGFPNGGLDRNSRHRDLDRRSRQYGPCAACRGANPPPTTVSSVVSYASRCTTPATRQPKLGCPNRAATVSLPPVDTDCVYALVGESKWLKTQRREKVNEVNTKEIEKERNGSFGGGESDERKTEEWNRGGSEGLVSSVTQKTWHDYQPENVIELLSGERLGWWSAQKFDKRMRKRALVEGAVNDASMRILLDTGANVSVMSERFAKQLRLREVRDHGRLYEYELWVMDHGAGVDVVLGTDFMIPAGVRLDLFHATTRLSDEFEIPIIKTQRMADTREEGPHVPDGPTEVLTIPGNESRDYRQMRQPPTNETHELWVRRTKELIPKVRTSITSGESSLTPVQETHISIRLKVRSTNDGWQPNHRRWKECRTTPTKILRRPSESSEGGVSDRDDQAECATATTEPSTEMVAEVLHQEEACPKLTALSDKVSEGSEVAQLKLEGAYLAAATVSEDWGDRDAPNTAEHPGNAIEFEDYARELAFLPDLTEAASTTLDYTRSHVQLPSLSVEQQDRVVKVLKSHERIMISSGSALPPPAYGVVCDIDVQEHPLIKPKARRIPLRHLKQLYELLKGLLKAGFIAFSDSPWASPIVIVLKKNGVDIRLCIDYKMVNSVTAILE